MAKHEYRILSRNTQGALADIVEEFLDNGWQLVGGLFIERQGKEPPVFYQAILRTSLASPMVTVKTGHEEVVMYSED